MLVCITEAWGQASGWVSTGEVFAEAALVAPHVPQPFTVVAGEVGVHLGQLSRSAFSQLCQLAQTQVRAALGS